MKTFYLTIVDASSLDTTKPIRQPVALRIVLFSNKEHPRFLSDSHLDRRRTEDS